MADDPDRTRWTDDRLDDRVRMIDRANDELATQVRMVAALVPQTAALQVTVEGLRDDVQAACRAASQARDAADKSRRDTMVAVLGFAAPITVALIGGVITLLIGGAP